MKKLGFAALAAGALTAGTLGPATPATAAPAVAGSAQDTLTSLEAEGYDVIVNRLSTTPLERAKVVSLGRGQSFALAAAGNTHTSGPVTRSTVYVNVQ